MSNNKLNSTHNYNSLKQHLGHEIVCVGYALKDNKGKRQSDWQNIAIECETCSEVLYDQDNPAKVGKQIQV